MASKVEFTELPNRGDACGFVFSPPQKAFDFIGQVIEMHLASVMPGAVRGNHYHPHKREAIVFLPGSIWSFHWDEGEGTPVQRHSFDGAAAVLVLISAGCSHALHNDGAGILWFTALSREAYDPGGVIARKVL
jgi:dTDP-4-dehydrorhamnose 3,5-epimerase-like enzyme